jgi:hypothetical protein
VTLVARHAAQDDKPLRKRPPAALARVFRRGLLFVTIATRMQIAERSGLRLGLRLRLMALLAHCHGLGPGVGDCDMRALRRARVDLQEPALHAMASNYLRAQIEMLGAGARPVLDELALAVAYLNVATIRAAMSAGRRGSPEASAHDFVDALVEAVDLSHTEAAGILGRLMATFAAGVESLWIFAAGR